MGFEPKKFIEGAISQMRSQVGKKHAIIAVSGGVDSMTAAAIASKAIPKQLTCIFVDTGLMRKNEAHLVSTAAAKAGIPLQVINASDKFFSSLKGITDPEEKRKIIGGLFIDVFEQAAKSSKAEFLIQGTIAPDWIESGSGLRDTIKSHHNVGGLPKKMGLFLCEPMRELYKDEVRKVAREIGLPLEFSERQPFPGPGLAVRIMGEITPQKAEIVREACAIVEEELEAAAHAKKMEMPWQYFAVLLPIKTVGVLGDARAYGYTIAVRAVESLDGMTAKACRIPPEVLEQISDRITRVLKEHVNRVVYDTTSKPPGTIEWE
ncbi:GMP synthase [glutamine-hydrolyzing] subunit B [Candidatus Anstonella stagnisolia]|nr:GMP synthase [glutamine-hydrolyzing] subunit B [Candidatus Anstonella stagnisolia]